MKALAFRLNLKNKLLCERVEISIYTANEILVLLRQRFHSVDETMKASHLLRYSTLKQQEGESGAAKEVNGLT
jgi:histone acetyltransferase (RNA polymerase elongator complex component)